MALTTVQDYVDRARVLLLDQVEPYRYPTDDLVEALNMGMLEVRRLRPELVKTFFGGEIPDYSASNMTATVAMDQQYRVSFVYYICGHAQLRDDEVNQDSRAAIFLNKFTSQMLSIQA
ncbi:MAG TPA: hypothetical protein V6D20_13410 [Candidatus Obscuribacterales bacterium]